MQHVEEAGVHSGDSACVIPPMSLGEEMLDEIGETTRRIALELGVIGLINIQYAVAGGRLYVIEANPRASRTVPFVSKAIGAPLAKLACRLMLGEPLAGDRAADDAQRPRLGQGGGAAVRPLRRRRLGARPGDEVDRRGDGDRRATSRPRSARRRRRPGVSLPDDGHRVHHRHRRRQGGRDRARGPLPRPRLRDHRHPRHGAGDLADGDPGDARSTRSARARRTSSTTSATARSTW